MSVYIVKKQKQIWECSAVQGGESTHLSCKKNHSYQHTTIDQCFPDHCNDILILDNHVIVLFYLFLLLLFICCSWFLPFFPFFVGGGVVCTMFICWQTIVCGLRKKKHSLLNVALFFMKWIALFQSPSPVLFFWAPTDFKRKKREVNWSA